MCCLALNYCSLKWIETFEIFRIKVILKFHYVIQHMDHQHMSNIWIVCLCDEFRVQTSTNDFLEVNVSSELLILT